MATFGWRYWNRDVKFKGEGLGTRVRKWWWSVNNWKVPEVDSTPKQDFARGAEEVSLKAKFSRLLQRRSA